jgi:hypothetical protein
LHHPHLSNSRVRPWEQRAQDGTSAKLSKGGAAVTDSDETKLIKDKRADPFMKALGCRGRAKEAVVAPGTVLVLGTEYLLHSEFPSVVELRTSRIG